MNAVYGPNLRELFHDPVGGWKSGQPVGAVGGHSNHVHIAWDEPRANDDSEDPQSGESIEDMKRGATEILREYGIHLELPSMTAAEQSGGGSMEQMKQDAARMLKDEYGIDLAAARSSPGQPPQPADQTQAQQPYNGIQAQQPLQLAGQGQTRQSARLIQPRQPAGTSQPAQVAPPVYSWTDPYTNSLADRFEQVKRNGTSTARADAQEIARELQRRGYRVQGLGPDEWPAIQAVLPQVQSQNDAGQVAVQRPTTARMEPWELTDAKRLADLFETAKRRGDFTAMKSLGQYLKDRYNYEYDLGADGWPYIKSPAGDIIPVSAREPSQGTQQFIENQIAQAQQERAAREFQAHDTRSAPRRFLESAGRDTAGAIFAAEEGLGRLAEDEIAKFQSKPSGPGFYAAPTNIGTYFRARGEQKGEEIQRQQAVEGQDVASQAGAFIGRAARTVGAGVIGGPGGVAALDSLEQYGRGATPGQALKTGLESYLGMELGGKLGAEFAARLANPFAKTMGGAIGAGRAASLGEYVGRAGGYAAGPQTVRTITSGLTTGQADVPDTPGKVALDLIQALGFALIGGKLKAEDAATIRGIANSPEVEPDAAQALRNIAAGSGFKGSEEVRVGSPAGPQATPPNAAAAGEQLQPPPPPTADPIASRIAEVDRELETVDPNSERAGRLLATRQSLARQRGARPESAAGSGSEPLRTEALDPDSMLGQARALHTARLQERASKISDELRYLRDVEGAGPDDPDVEKLERERLGIAQAGEWTHQILNNLEHNPEWEKLPLVTKRVILGLNVSSEIRDLRSTTGADLSSEEQKEQLQIDRVAFNNDLRNGPLIRGTNYRVGDMSGKIPRSLVNEIARAPYLRDLTAHMEATIGLMQDRLSQIDPIYNDAQFHGILLHSRVGGVNVRKGELPSTKNLILINPYRLAQEVLNQIESGQTQISAGPSALARKIVSVMLHEVNHQGSLADKRPHGRKFLRNLDNNATRLRPVIDAVTEEMTNLLKENGNYVYKQLLRHQERLATY
jgi:hypothetical protein